MPFGLMNTPAVFKRLMKLVPTGFNPADGNDFVVVYLDNILIFSPDHPSHLQTVIDRLQEITLKLKPSKCKFVGEEVEYLGHIITPHGLRPNAHLTEVVQDFLRP